MHPKLLCIGREPMLLDTRLRVLSRLHPVEGTVSLAELMSSNLHSQEFDVIVFCHSLSEAERHELVSFARERWPQAGLLAIYNSRSKYNPGEFDASVEGIQGPSAMLQAVETLLRRRGAETAGEPLVSISTESYVATDAR